MRVEKSRTAQPRGNFDLHAVTGTCRWVSANGLYCFGNKQQEDSFELLVFFDRHPNVHCLWDFPQYLCDSAFCNLHSAAAKLHCTDAEVDTAVDDALIKREDSDRDKQIVLWRAATKVQYLTFGDNDRISFDLGEEQDAAEKQDAIRDPTTRTVRLQRKERPLHVHETEQTEESNENKHRYLKGSEAEFKIADDSDNEAQDEKHAEVFKRTRIAEETLKKKGELTPRAQQAYDTGYRDGSYTGGVSRADEEIVIMMEEHFEIANATPGYVYAFRDQELELVKVGFTQQSLSKRLGSIKSACHVGEPMDILAGDGLEPVLEYKRLEKLIHAYLQPHRWFFRCACGKKKNTLHGEYFDISNEMARDVFNVWRSFILQHPYSPGASRSSYTLRPEWMVRIRDREIPSEKEKHEDHEIKLARWRRTLRPSDDKIPHSRSVGDANQGIAADATGRTRVKPENIARAQPASPDQKNHSDIVHKATSVATHNQGSLAIPTESLKISRSRSLTPPPGFPVTATTQKPAALGEEAEARKSRLIRMTEMDHTVRPASSAGERTTFGTSPQYKLEESNFPSIPTSTFTFTTPIPVRSNASHQAKGKASQVELAGPSTSSERERTTQNKDTSRTAGPTALGSQSKIDWAAKYMELEQILHRPREGLPSRTIWEDLVSFRWPLAFAVSLAASSSHIPSFLAFIIWAVFLPCFVGELRSWFPELDRKQ